MGTSAYARAFAITKVFQVGHSPLKMKIRPSQGMFERLNWLKENQDIKGQQIMPLSPADTKNYWEGAQQFEGFATPDARFLCSYSLFLLGFVTLDPDIKTIYDLEGKKVGLGKSTQMFWAQVPQRVLEVAGVNAKLDFVGPGPAAKGVQDGIYDACVTQLSPSVKVVDGQRLVDTKVAPVPAPDLEKMLAGRRAVYAIDMTESLIAEVVEAQNWGQGAFPVAVAKGTLGESFAREDMYLMGYPYGFYTFESCPAPVAQEFVEGFIRWQDEISVYDAGNAILTPGAYTAGMSWDTLHEGAQKALETFGWTSLVPGAPELK